jgi:hypothetical protein
MKFVSSLSDLIGARNYPSLLMKPIFPLSLQDMVFKLGLLLKVSHLFLKLMPLDSDYR